MRKAIVFATVLLTFSSLAKGQNNLGLALKAYDPKGDFNNNIDKVPVGLGLYYLHGKEDSHWKFGGELGVAMYTEEEYEYLFESGNSVRMSEEDCFWTIHGMVRYYPLKERGISPYTELRLGFTTFFSTIMSLDPEYNFLDRGETHGSAFNTGLGAGVMIDPELLITKGSSGRYAIDLGVSWLSGTHSTYRNVEHATNVNNLEEGRYHSLTGYVDYRMGFIIKFRGDH